MIYRIHIRLNVLTETCGKNTSILLPSNDMFHDVSKQTLHVSTISSFNCLLPPAGNTEKTQYPQLLSSRLSQVSLWWENVNVSFTPVLSFIMIKQFILWEKGEREMQAVASFIACPVSFTRLWFFIMLLSAARQEAGLHWNKSLIFCFLISFFLPVVSPISLFILHMWLPAC